MTTQKSHLLLATIYMFGAIASFTAMAVAGRAVSFQLDTFEIMLFRSVVGAVLVLAWRNTLPFLTLFQGLSHKFNMTLL